MIGAVTISPFHLTTLRKFNVWYTVKDGNWTDPGVWMSNGKKRYTIPQAGDDVYISHNIGTDVDFSNSYTITLNNLRISASGNLAIGINFHQTFIYINGDLQVLGTLDFSASPRNHLMSLGGVNNYINNLICGISTIEYHRNGDQPVISLPYYSLQITGSGKKYLINDLSTIGDLNVLNTGFFEIGNYNITIGGQTLLQGSNTIFPATISKTSGGSVLFKGLLNISNNPSSVNFTGNPTIECQGGITFKNDAITTNFGTGTLNFTTNNQTLTLSNGNSNPNSAFAYVPVTNLIVNIVGNITVTNNAYWLLFNGVINGTASGSTLTNNAHLLFGNPSQSMTTGTFNYSTSGTTIGYVFNGDYTLPYNNYQQIFVDGTGTKTPNSGATWTDLFIGAKLAAGTFTLTNNITMSGNVYIAIGTLECGLYNLTVGGSTSLVGQNAKFSKNGSGSLIFIGVLSNTVFNATISLPGNPTIEFKGGLYIKKDGVYNFGTRDITFTTNNQTIQSENFIYPDLTYKAILSNNIIISGAITITYTSDIWIMTGILNGTVSGSTFINDGYIQYRNAQQPMQTGVLSTNSAINYFEYGLSGNQDITPGIYRNLTLSGSGAKRLLGNVSVQNTYTLTNPVTLNTNGFTLTNP